MKAWRGWSSTPSVIGVDLDKRIKSTPSSVLQSNYIHPLQPDQLSILGGGRSFDRTSILIVKYPPSQAMTRLLSSNTVIEYRGEKQSHQPDPNVVYCCIWSPLAIRSPNKRPNCPISLYLPCFESHVPLNTSGWCIMHGSDHISLVLMWL